MCRLGQFYYDKVLPFGLRSATFLFNQLSDTLDWILIHICKISFVCHILDDFLLAEPSAPPPFQQLCSDSLQRMLSTFHNIRIPIASAKKEGPAQELQFMGITLDTIRMEARLPADKIDRIRTALQLFQSTKAITLRELQSLIGTLNFACKVIPPG